jgi:hypothetical protein
VQHILGSKKHKNNVKVAAAWTAIGTGTDSSVSMFFQRTIHVMIVNASSLIGKLIYTSLNVVSSFLL